MGFYDFKNLKKELELYRENDMSPFQKINHFFITYTNDRVFFYVNGKIDYEVEEACDQSSSKDFLMRQILI